jgi:thiamine biosynthesis protein ThiS
VVLTLNGESTRVDDVATVAALLLQLGLDPRSVVVERNRSIVRRSEVANTPVHDGDAIELVHFVGGG